MCRLFCRHEWEKITEYVLESPILEHLNEFESITGHTKFKKYIVIFECTKCGKIKKFTESV